MGHQPLSHLFTEQGVFHTLKWSLHMSMEEDSLLLNELASKLKCFRVGPIMEDVAIPWQD